MFKSGNDPINAGRPQFFFEKSVSSAFSLSSVHELRHIFDLLLSGFVIGV